MMSVPRSCVLALLGTIVLSSVTRAQARVQPVPPPVAPLAPPTKLEAFKPAAGTVVTFGYNNLGTLSGISVDAREMRDSKANLVRGVVVEVTQGEYREERAFIDSDELPELLKGIDAILGVKANPTTFENFEVQYQTKGELQITAFSSTGGGIRYAVEAGRPTKARIFVDEEGLRKLRGFFEAARQLLSTLPNRA